MKLLFPWTLCNVKKGSAKGSKETVGTVSKAQLKEIAEILDISYIYTKVLHQKALIK